MRMPALVTGALAGLLTAASASAQLSAPPATGTAFELTPYAGYMIFGDYLKGPLGTSISNAPGPIYGAQLGMKLAPNISLVGNLGYTSSDIKVGVPILGGVSIAHSSTLLYDGGLQFDFPLASTSGVAFKPFIQVGAGAMRYDISESILQTNTTNFAGNAGLGADITLGQGLGLRLMAKDYIGKFNFKDATDLNISGETSQNFALSAGLRLAF